MITDWIALDMVTFEKVAKEEGASIRWLGIEAPTRCREMTIRFTM